PGCARENISRSGIERWLPVADECARSMGQTFIGGEHLALAMLSEPHGNAARTLEQLNVKTAVSKRALVEQTMKSRFGQVQQSHRFRKGISLLSVLAGTVILAAMHFSPPNGEPIAPQSNRAKGDHETTAAKKPEISEDVGTHDATPAGHPLIS